MRCTSFIDIVLSLRIDLDSINEWLRANKLTLNVSKTKYVYIGTKALLYKLAALDLCIAGESIEHASVFKYLGLQLNECLTVDFQIDKVYNKDWVQSGRYKIALASRYC